MDELSLMEDDHQSHLHRMIIDLLPTTYINTREITSICNYRFCLRRIPRQEREKIAFQGGDIKINFTPLNYISRMLEFPYHHEGGWTVENLIVTICDKYMSLYQEEEQANGPIRTSRDGRRIEQTHGPYGFHGYSPHFLALVRIDITLTGHVYFKTNP